MFLNPRDRMDVCGSILTPYCHISLSYITSFWSWVQRSQLTPFCCTVCQYRTREPKLQIQWRALVVPWDAHELPIELHCKVYYNYVVVHRNLRNINPHTITHSLISLNPRERMFMVQISLLIVTFLSLIPRVFFFVMNAKKSAQPIVLRRVSICGVSSSRSSFSYAACWMLVLAYATSRGKGKWSGPHQQRWEEKEFKFHSVTCYTNSIVSRIHVNTP